MVDFTKNVINICCTSALKYIHAISKCIFIFELHSMGNLIGLGGIKSKTVSWLSWQIKIIRVSLLQSQFCVKNCNLKAKIWSKNSFFGIKRGASEIRAHFWAKLKLMSKKEILGSKVQNVPSISMILDIVFSILRSIYVTLFVYLGDFSVIFENVLNFSCYRWFLKSSKIEDIWISSCLIAIPLPNSNYLSNDFIA